MEVMAAAAFCTGGCGAGGCTYAGCCGTGGGTKPPNCGGKFVWLGGGAENWGGNA